MITSFLKRYARWSCLSAVSGLLSGVAAAVFLILLDWATRSRESQPQIILGLPLAGLAIGLLYHYLGREVSAGNNLILDEIHDPKKVVPARMAPLVLLGTILTHLFGGSAGREGTAVQMGASLSDQLNRLFKIEVDERKILLVAGTGAGFGAAIGAPWAGMIFGMEVIAIGKLRPFAWFECLIASFTSYHVALRLGAPHSVYPTLGPVPFDLWSLAAVGLAGIAFGLAVIAFVKLTHVIERAQARLVKYAPLRPVIGGLVLIALYRFEGSYRYAGLGISEIQTALQEQRTISIPLLKGIFTAITIGSGFKGGEFIPLVFMGSTLGSALAAALPGSVQLLGSVGFAAAFAAASNTPVACSVMAIEIFGWSIAPYAFVGCFLAYYVSGGYGIYKSQKVLAKKHRHFLAVVSWLGELPKRFLH